MTNGNDPANPATVEYDEKGMKEDFKVGHTMYQTKGLTKREYFAAMALQGLLACDRVTEFQGEDSPSTLAVVLADALIEKLNKGEGKK